MGALGPGASVVVERSGILRAVKGVGVCIVGFVLYRFLVASRCLLPHQIRYRTWPELWTMRKPAFIGHFGDRCAA